MKLFGHNLIFVNYHTWRIGAYGRGSALPTGKFIDWQSSRRAEYKAIDARK
jgi:hypothetical protein